MDNAVDQETKERWVRGLFTFKEIRDNNYRVKKGEKSTVKDSKGTPLFHAKQIWDGEWKASGNLCWDVLDVDEVHCYGF